MSLLLNMLSRLVITFLPRSKRLLISWLQSPSAVILEPKKIKSDAVSTVSPSISHEVMALDAMIFIFWMLSFKPTFSLSTFTFIKRLLSSSSLSAIRVVSSAYLRLLRFLPAVLIPACVWRRKWQPTPVLLPGKSHGLRSLVGYSPWCCKQVINKISLLKISCSVYPSCFFYIVHWTFKARILERLAKTQHEKD